MSAGRDLVATAALAAYSLTAAAVFVRIFDGWAFLTDAFVIVLVGHALSFAFRRVHVPIWLALPLLMGLMTIVVAALNYRETLTALGLPGRDTWAAFTSDASEVRELFPTTTAPVDYIAGWAALASIGIAGVVVFADTFAFRADARAEALVPGGVLFVFLSALGDGGGGVALATALVAVGVVTVVALRWRQDPSRPQIRSAERPAPSLVAPAVVGVALAVALVAGVVGPRLPGAAAPPLYETKGRSGGVTEVVSPLVDIRARLVDQSDTEVFRVTASTESYWRATTLPEFDGTTFRLPTRSLERVEGGLGPSRVGAEQIRQDIEIRALGGQLVPAAAEPIEASGPDLRWNPDTSTLVAVGGDVETGDRYVVISASPRFQPSELRAASASNSPDPIHLHLPADLPPIVADTARSVAGAAPTPYDAALALQAWFRNEFTYSLDIPPGHGTSAIESFLLQRIGYCEQFAATFAAMARTLGIPSRVAVGYTSGVLGADGTYSVLGRHAHAWPELWFDGLGWVPFEPTPGRGAPGTEQYTGVAPDQDTTPIDDEPEPTPSTVSPIDPADQPDPSDLLPDFADPSAGQGGEPPAAVAQGESGSRSWWPAIVLALLAAVVALPAVVRRGRRRLAERSPATDRVTAAWQQATSAARRAGVRGTDSMTTSEWAAATSAALPVAARPIGSLATVVDALAYGPPGSIDLDRTSTYGTSLARDCAVWARQIDTMARDQLDLRDRVVGYFVRWR